MTLCKGNDAGRWRVVAICGPREADEELLGLAEAVGAGVIGRGWALACGGLGGVMKAAARGARQAREELWPPIIGIVPGELSTAANSYCDVVIASGLGLGRNAILVQSADAVLLCGGGAGTLSEAAMAWQLGKPVVALSRSGGWAAELAGACIDARRRDAVMRAEGVEDALQRLEGLWG